MPMLYARRLLAVAQAADRMMMHHNEYVTALDGHDYEATNIAVDWLCIEREALRRALKEIGATV